MRLNIFFTGVLIQLILFQSSIYDIQVQTVQGNSIDMSAFANKKIMITTISAVSNVTQLQFLDSLQNSDTTLKVIAVPALDFGGTENNGALLALSNTLGLDFTIVKSAYTTKAAGSDQHSLFKWLTHVADNAHFDLDVEAVGQFFIVSKTGTLYSVLPPDVPSEILTQALNQNIVQ